MRTALADRGIGPVDERDGRSRRRESVRGHGRRGDAGVAYHLGEWRWFAEPRLRLDPQPIERRANDPIVAAASRTPAARATISRGRGIRTSRSRRADDGYVVRVRDARYHGLGGLEGPDVRLDGQLEPLAAQ